MVECGDQDFTHDDWEFGFEDIFLAEVAAIETGADSHTITVSTVNYRAVSYILFIFFLIIMSIIIMNLLVGLAVDDIKGVQENAELESLKMQVKLTLDVYYSLPRFFQRQVRQKRLVFQPNKYCNRWALRWWHSAENLNHSTIQKVLNSKKKKRERQVESVEVRLKSMEGMMAAIVSHFNTGPMATK
uniref:Ankyrin repeats-like n=1 Tax=Phallusia mammillata TaxID=59560 RepID=A0A6F9DVE7_9ASCI|nr:ankyrin repeats-like [Phallusia mammillata]